MGKKFVEIVILQFYFKAFIMAFYSFCGYYFTASLVNIFDDQIIRNSPHKQIFFAIYLYLICIILKVGFVICLFTFIF